MSGKQINLVQLNVAVLLWSGTAMFAKGIALPTEHIVCLRSLVGAMALLFFLVPRKLEIRLKAWRDYRIMALLGLLLCLHWLTYFQALKVSTAAVTIISLQTYPVFTALIEPFVFREKLRKIDVILALTVFVGILIMMPTLDLSNATTQGIALGLSSGIFFMIRNLMTRKYVQVYSGSTLMFWQMLFTGVVLLPVLFRGTKELTYSGNTLGLIVVLGVVFTALPHTLFTASFKHLSARTVGILSSVLPLYAAIMGYLVHAEMVTLRIAIGGLIILTSVIIETALSVKRNGGS
jgi:drug/metabolite transporter (DMT)-like permease